MKTMTTRPPKTSRHVAPPPATVRPNELRRQQLRSYQENGHVDFLPLTHEAFPTPPLVGRSFSSSFDEPDNTSILRGAQILRQQFMEQYAASTTTAASAKEFGGINNRNHHHNLQNNAGQNLFVEEDISSGIPTPKRLFPDKNDEAFQDLLGTTRPIQPPGSPNDVMMSIANTDTPAAADQWTTDPWNLRGSAFDPASKGAIRRDQRQDGTLIGGRHHNSIIASTAAAAHHIKQQRREDHHHQLPRKEEEEPAQRHQRYQTTVTKREPSSSSSSSPQRQQQPSSLQPLSPTTPWRPTRSFQMASSSPGGGGGGGGGMPSSPQQKKNTNDRFHMNEDDDDKQWMSVSGTGTADITGPIPYEYRGDDAVANFRTSLSDDFASLERKEDILLNDRYFGGGADDDDGAGMVITRTSLSDDFESLEQKENIIINDSHRGHHQNDEQYQENNAGKRLGNGGFIISNMHTAKHRNREDDKETFEQILDSISLEDETFEEFLNKSKDDEDENKPADFLGKWRTRWDTKCGVQFLEGPNNSEQEHQQQHSDSGAAARTNKSVSFAKSTTGTTRGRKQERSLSSYLAMESSSNQSSTRRRRSRSASGREGVDRTTTTARRSHQGYPPISSSSNNARGKGGGGQSSLRDDLLCGMETQCTTDLTPEEERFVRSEIVVEDSCVCGDAQQTNDEARYHQQDARRRGNKHKYNQMPSLSPSRRQQQHVVVREEDRFGVLSPGSDEYHHMQKNDPAFRHAVKAGGLWQALVGNHVRFPKEWWQGRYRTAPLGLSKKLVNGNKWIYYDRHRIKGNRVLNLFLKRRDEPGQILLHLVVRDFLMSSPILDIAIGCFHPNAKSIRSSALANKRLEDCRDVWMAVRFRTKDVISVIDPTFLAEKIGQPKKTPLGDSKRKISNSNVRAIFGETPPLRTAFVLESDIYEMLVAMDASDTQVHGPADILLKKYLFQSCNFLD